MKQLRILTTFYGTFSLPSWIITLGCWSAGYRYGLSTFNPLFWFKIMTMGVLAFVVTERKSREFYYFRNLGWPIPYLWAITLGFDFFVCIFLLILISLKG